MPTINTGWNTLPLGCGGLTTGMDIAPDGTVVIRSDASNAYIFGGKFPADLANPNAKWLPLFTHASVNGGAVAHPSCSYGGTDVVIAPTATTHLYATTCAFDWAGGTAYVYLYYSTDAGAHWTKVSATQMTANVGGLGDMDSNGNYKLWSHRIAVDPVNANVVYCGMNTNGGNAFSVYRATDGVTFSGIPTSTIPLPTDYAGVTGMCFDQQSGTVTGVAGLTVTKRFLLSVNGVGIYETNDGGVTFSEIGVAGTGSAGISVAQSQIDYDGNWYSVIYAKNTYTGTISGSTLTVTSIAAGNKVSIGAQLSCGGQVSAFNGTGTGGTGTYTISWGPSSFSGTITTTGQEVWRCTRAGVWDRLDDKQFWTLTGVNGTILQNFTCVAVDPRNGHQGWVTLYNAGFGSGFTSKNANNATASTVTWGGVTGGSYAYNFGPSYDAPWLTHGLAGLNGPMGGTYSIIDQNGYQWWTGNQGAIWYYTLADNATPTLADFSTTQSGGPHPGAVVTWSTTISRGVELTVASGVCRPPGGQYPIMAPQDIGAIQGTFTAYPTDYYYSGTYVATAAGHTGSPDYPGVRADCETISASWTDAGVASTLISVESNPTSYSGYSLDYGATWHTFANQPDAYLYGTGFANGFTGSIAPGASYSVTGSIASGQLTVTGFTTTGAGGGIVIGSIIAGGSLASSGCKIVSQLSGTPNGNGVYEIDWQYYNPGTVASNTYTASGYGVLTVTTAGNGSLGVGHGFARGGGCSNPVCGTGIDPGQQVIGTTPSSTAGDSMSVTQLLTGTGKTGTYVVDRSITVASTGDISERIGTGQSGQILCFDRDHHLMIPAGYEPCSVPVYTTNATGSCTWHPSEGIPVRPWMMRTFVYGWTKPLTTDPNTAGQAFAVDWTTGQLYKTTDYGATWSSSGLGTTPITTYQGAFGGFGIYTVPGQPNHLWFALSITSPQTAGLWRSTDGGASWSAVSLPGAGTGNLFTMGKQASGGSYPTLFAFVWSGFGTTSTLYYSQNAGSTWHILGNTGTNLDLPTSCQIPAVTTIDGDWNDEMLLYASVGGSGFAYYYGGSSGPTRGGRQLRRVFTR